MRRAIVLVIMVAALLTIGNGKETVMAYGDNWAQYGQPLGYSQAQWDALPQAKKNSIKEAALVQSMGQKQALTGFAGDSLPGYEPAPLDYAPAPDAYTDYATDPGGSGSGAGYTAAAPTRLLNESPEWLAYLNALNMEEAQFRADVDKTRGLYQSDAERQKQDLIPVYGQSRRGIAGSLESRGMARSGELLRKLSENRAQEGRQRAGIEANLAGQTSSLESQLAQKLVGLGTQRTEREMQMRSQGYV